MAKLQQYVEESRFHRLLQAAIKPSEDIRLENIERTLPVLEDDGSKSPCNKKRRIRVPPVQVIQEISSEALYYLELFESACSRIHQPDPQSSEASFVVGVTPAERLLLQSPTWSQFAAFLFWPLEHSATCERLMELQMSLYDAAHLSSSVTLFDATTATTDQRALCLQLLAASLSTSPSFFRLFIRLDGHWGAALLAELDISERTLSLVSRSSIEFQNAIVKFKELRSFFGAAPLHATKVKVCVLRSSLQLPH